MSEVVNDKNIVLYKHNVLIESKNEFTELQAKIFDTLLTKFQESDEILEDYKYTTQEVQSLMGVTKNFKEFQIAIEGIQDVKVRRREGTKERIVNLFHAITVDHEYHDVVVTLHPDLKELLYNRTSNKNDYTPLKLYEIKKLRGEYGIKLYELLYRYRNESVAWFLMEDFRYIMSIPDTYPFKEVSRLIKKWVDGINHNTSLDVYDIIYSRAGRYVKKIGFAIRENEQLSLAFDDTIADPVRSLFDKNGLTITDHGARRLKEYSGEALQDAINKFKLKHKDGKFAGSAIAWIETCAQNYVGFKDIPNAQKENVALEDPEEMVLSVLASYMSREAALEYTHGLSFIKAVNGLRVSGDEIFVNKLRERIGRELEAIAGAVEWVSE